MRDAGARILPRAATPTAAASECLSDKYENQLPAHLAQSTLMAGMAATPAPSFPLWPCEMFCSHHCWWCHRCGYGTHVWGNAPGKQVLIVTPYSFSIIAGDDLASDDRPIFVFNFHSHAGVVHIWPAIQILMPYILSISLIWRTIHTCISTNLHAAYGPAILLLYLYVEGEPLEYW